MVLLPDTLNVHRRKRATYTRRSDLRNLCGLATTDALDTPTDEEVLMSVRASFADKNRIYKRLLQYRCLVLATRNVDERVPLFVQLRDEPDEVRREALSEILPE